MRVAAGSIAKKYLHEVAGVRIYAYLSAIGDIDIDVTDVEAIEKNPFFSPDPGRVDEIAGLRAAGEMES